MKLPVLLFKRVERINLKKESAALSPGHFQTLSDASVSSWPYQYYFLKLDDEFELFADDKSFTNRGKKYEPRGISWPTNSGTQTYIE